MRFSLFPALTLLAAGGTLACSDSTVPAAGRPISVSFTTASATGASFSRSFNPTATHDVTATVGTDALVISKAQIVVARIELQQVGATCTSEVAAGDDHEGNDDQECAELELAPTVVDLPVNGSVVSALDITVPAGSYSSLEAKVRPIRSGSDAGSGSSAFLTAHPELEGVSVLVEGTFNGTPFTYKGTAKAGLEHSFSPALTVGTTPVNLTVNFDLANWFKSSSGALIDPATANAGGVNATTVADNIKRSFRAFRDDDHNGQDDDGAGHH
jgi:hypothetical protein